MMDDMAHNADCTLAKSPGIVRPHVIRGHRRAPLHGSAGKQTRSWHPKGPETRRTTGCCIRSKSSRFQAHPFREGNGRASKLFMQHVAEQSRFAFDYARVTPDEWNQGSALSAPDLYAYAPDPRSLVPVFDAITVERRPGQTAGLDDPSRARSALRASYPQAATDATRSTPPAGGIQGRGSAPYTPGARYGSERGEGR